MGEGLKAHIKDGQIVFDEPVDLPEGTKLRVLPIDDGMQIDPELEQAIEDGFSDFDRGDFVEAEALAQALTAKS